VHLVGFIIRIYQNVRSSECQIPINSSNANLNPICHLLALLGAHHIRHVSGERVNNETCVPFSYFHYLKPIVNHMQRYFKHQEAPCFAQTVFRIIITTNSGFSSIQHWFLKSKQTVFSLSYEFILFRKAD
jgi:hypothetical protein